MKCPLGKCGSSNVESLPHYWAALPSDSPLKAKYAEPPTDKGQYLIAIGVVALGVFALASGSIAGGLLMLLVGACWLAVTHQRVEAAEAKRATWAREVICLACTERFEP
jgi:hypothetical protein